jgi:hypothetical protein
MTPEYIYIFRRPDARNLLIRNTSLDGAKTRVVNLLMADDIVWAGPWTHSGTRQPIPTDPEYHRLEPLV